MQVWSNLLLVLQILSAIAMIGLVLVQHGKGADMGASFGSGASGSLFGATGSANFLSRSTAVCATIFFGATLALAGIASHRSDAPAVQVGGPNRLDSALGAPAAPSAASASATILPAAAASSAPAAAASTPASSAPAIPTR